MKNFVRTFGIGNKKLLPDVKSFQEIKPNSSNWIFGGLARDSQTRWTYKPDANRPLSKSSDESTVVLAKRSILFKTEEAFKSAKELLKHPASIREILIDSKHNIVLATWTHSKISKTNGVKNQHITAGEDHKGEPAFVNLSARGTKEDFDSVGIVFRTPVPEHGVTETQIRNVNAVLSSLPLTELKKISNITGLLHKDPSDVDV